MSEQRGSHDASDPVFVEAGFVAERQRQPSARRLPQKPADCPGSIAQCEAGRQGSFACTCAILSRLGATRA